MSLVDGFKTVDCPPMFATPRPVGESRGGELVSILELLLESEAMPWQRQVAETALALDDSGGLVFRQVVLTIPRQCGKTTLLAALVAHRLLAWPVQPQSIVWGAQGLTDATAVWEEQLYPQFERSGLVDGFGLKMRRSLNQFGLRARNGSSCRVLSNSPSAGHGRRVDLALVDEAMAFVDHRREQALLPAMRTVADSQFWVVSTAGDESSVYLRGKVERGRRMVNEGQSVKARTAYFEWGAHRDADWTDRKVWRSAIPAIGHTIDLDAIQSEYEMMEPDEFRRASLNQWLRDEDVGAVPWEDWMAARSHMGPPQDAPVFVGVDAPPRSSGDTGTAAIIVCGGDTLEVVATGRGLAWVTETLLRVLTRNQIAGIGFIKSSPLDSVRLFLESQGHPVVTLAWPDVASACERFFDAVVSRRLKLYHSETSRVLDDAVKHTDISDRSSGSWIWRGKPGKSVAPLYAATLAYEMARRDQDVPKPANPFAAWDNRLTSV